MTAVDGDAPNKYCMSKRQGPGGLLGFMYKTTHTLLQSVALYCVSCVDRSRKRRRRRNGRPKRIVML